MVSLVRSLTRAWVPLVVAAALALGGFTVYQTHGIFGSQPANAGAGGGTVRSRPTRGAIPPTPVVVAR